MAGTRRTNGVNYLYTLFPGVRIGCFQRSDYPQMVVEQFIDVPLKPRGSFRMKQQQLVSLRGEKVFTMARRHRLGVILDLFNVANASKVTHVQELRLDSSICMKLERLVMPKAARLGIRNTC